MLPTADCYGEGVYLLAQAGRQAGEPAQLWGEDLCWKEPPWVTPSLAPHLTLCLPRPGVRLPVGVSVPAGGGHRAWLCAALRCCCGQARSSPRLPLPTGHAPPPPPYCALCLSTLTSSRSRSRIFICSPPHLPGLDVDGIYRVSGNLAVVQKLRFLVDRGEKAVGRWSC